MEGANCLLASLVCLLVGTGAFATANVCQHQRPANMTMSPSYLKGTYDNVNPQPFRLKLVYTNAFYQLPNYDAVIKQLVEPSLKTFEQLFKTRVPKREKHHMYHGCRNNHYAFRPDENGVMKHYCVKGCASESICYEAKVPAEVVGECRTWKDGKFQTVRGAGEGADADFIMIITSENTDGCSGNLLAYAISCQNEAGTDRPDVGMMNLCQHAIRLDKNGIVSSKGTVMHEAMHAMGFAESHFAYFRDASGEPITPRDPKTGRPDLGSENNIPIPSEKILKRVQRRWLSTKVEKHRTVKALVTPTLLRLAREHYGCPTLDGVEMESQGGSSTAGSHFEKRTLMNEIMTGSTSENPIFSKLTLAYFQDSGWYDVDLSKGEPLNWGKGLGCDFVYQSCYEYMYRKRRAKQQVFPWCDRLQYTFKRKQYGNYFGRCMLRSSTTPISPEFQSINKLPHIPAYKWSQYGGDEELADHCPYIKE